MFNFLKSAGLMAGTMALQTSVLTAGICLSSASVFSQSERQSLDISWTLLNDSLGGIPAPVPGNNFMALQEAGLIPDPSLPGNDERTAWVSRQDWVFRSDEFAISQRATEPGLRLILRFPEITPGAEVLLNGNSLGRCENQFFPCEFEVADLPADGNRIEVRFRSPMADAAERVSQTAHPLPGDPERAVVRRPQYQFGWDWAPRVVPSGISAKPELIIADRAIITSASIGTVSLSHGKASMVLRADIRHFGKKNSPFRISLRDAEEQIMAEKTVTLAPGNQSLVVNFDIENPDLWNTWDRGRPVLHHAKVVLEYEGESEPKRIDVKHLTYGIRTARLIRESDYIGQSFKIRLNGEDIFARGANYVPLDIFPERTPASRYRELLMAARGANMNMVRVWGGGLYESEYFYHLCDSLGLMVWQDFMFACSMYPGDRSFRQSVANEAGFQTQRLAAHPSVVLWCGNNEVSEGWQRWGWQDGLGRREKRRIKRSYHRVFHRMLPATVQRNTDLSYVPSSPELGRGDPRHITRGSAHNWWVWHDEAPFDNYLEQVPRFMSEFGYQSLPEAASLAEWMNGEKPTWAAPPLSLLQRHSRGFDIIAKQLTDWGLKGKTIEDTLFLSQILQAEAMGTGIRAHRTGRPGCMGSLLWQLNDCGPAISWSLIDSQMRPKQAYFRVKRDLEPVNIMHLIRNDSLLLFLIIDEVWEKPARVVVSAETFDSEGEALAGRKLMPMGRSNSIQIIDALPISEYTPRRWPRECYAVVSFMVDGRPDLTREKVIFFGHPGEFPLNPPMIEIATTATEDGRYRLLISSVAPARFVWLSASEKGHFDHNGLDIVPGYPREVYFTPIDNYSTPRFAYHSMWDVIGVE